MAAEPGRWTHPNAPYSMIVDGELFEAPPWFDHRASGTNRELVCGFTTDEARMFTADVDLSGSDPVETARACGLDANAVRTYRTGNPGISDEEPHALILSDALFRIPTLWCAEAGNDTYLYEFAWPSPARDGAFRACHGLDVSFTFDTPPRPARRAAHRAGDSTGFRRPRGGDAQRLHRLRHDRRPRMAAIRHPRTDSPNLGDSTGAGQRHTVDVPPDLAARPYPRPTSDDV